MGRGKQEWQQVEDLFDLYDADFSGTIDTDELAAIFHSLGQDPGDQYVQDILKEVDADGSGELNYMEFVLLLAKAQVGNFRKGLHSRGVEREEAPLPAVPGFSTIEVEMLREMFDMYDTETNGVLSPEQLVRCMRAMGYAPSQRDIRNIMIGTAGRQSRVNAAGERELLLPSFLTAISHYKERHGEPGMRLLTASKTNTASSRHELWFREMFDHFDAEGKGWISGEIFGKAICACTGHFLSQHELAQAIDEADEDGMGTVYFPGFLNVMVKYWFREKAPQETLDEELLHAFEMLDPDKTGFIDFDAFRDGLMKNADPLTAAEVDDLLKNANVDRTGRLNYKNLIKTGVLG
eukprot:TRINITY_DN65730_c0_g1_i1.p1 TRINITY_DN65730_c0_g1~~TRINITY_DN65730_c0_g1_i1.p1  ORF type:complete len:350 (-),score=80.35 TRINITY_DN65730_c0_g1_i1:216-1265(-)